MNAAASHAVQALNERFFMEFPVEAAHELETLPAAEIAETLSAHSPAVSLRPWQRLTPDIAASVLRSLPADRSRYLL